MTRVILKVICDCQITRILNPFNVVLSHKQLVQSDVDNIMMVLPMVSDWKTSYATRDGQPEIVLRIFDGNGALIDQCYIVAKYGLPIVQIGKACEVSDFARAEVTDEKISI